MLPPDRRCNGLMRHLSLAALGTLLACVPTAPARASEARRPSFLIILTDDQRWAIIEYIKSIPEEAGRVTPFGGPPNAQTSNSPWTKYDNH